MNDQVVRSMLARHAAADKAQQREAKSKRDQHRKAVAAMHKIAKR